MTTLQAPTEQLMTIKQLGLLLNTTPRSIYFMIYKNQIPYVRLGKNGSYRFSKEHVMSVINSYSKK